MSFSFVQMPWATSKKEAQNIDEAKAEKDWDGDGEIETGKQEWKGSKDKAIKKAMNDDEDPVAKKKKKSKSDIKDEPEGENGDTADMNPKVESIEFDDMLSLNEDSFDAYLDTLTYEELVELEEGIIGGTARLVGKGIGALAKGAMAGAHRMTAAGRADAAERKLAKVQKKKDDIKRRETAQKKIARIKSQNPSMLSKVGSAVGSAAKTAAKGVAQGVKTALSPEKKPLAAGTEPDSNKSSIREKLFSVVERKDHGRTDNSDDWDEKYTGKGAKKMRIDHNGPIDGSVDQRIKDTVKSGREGPTAKARSGGDATRSGDQKIVQGGTPMKDPAATRVKEALEIIETVLEANYDIADEIINELSMDTLKSYRQKAKGDVTAKKAKADLARLGASKTYDGDKHTDLKIKSDELNKKAAERSAHRNLAKGKMQIKKGFSWGSSGRRPTNTDVDKVKSTYKFKAEGMSKENFSGTGHSLNGVMNAYTDMYTEKVSSGVAQHSLTDDEKEEHSSYMKKKHGVTTKYKGSDELSYHGNKKQVRSALDNHYGENGDQKALHPNIYK